MSFYQKHIFICTNQKEDNKKCCFQGDAFSAWEYFKEKLAKLNLSGPGKIRVSRSGCLGRCGLGPCIVIYPEGTWYTYKSIEDLDRIIENHLIKNEILAELRLPDLNEEKI